MEKYNIIMMEDATEDLEDIYIYISIELKSTTYAENQINRIKERILELKVFPERYQIIDWEIEGRKDIRRMPVDKYNVLYIVQSNQVRVFNVIHSTSNIENKVKKILNK